MYRKSDLFTIFLLVLVFEQTCGTALDGDCTSVACVTPNAVCTTDTKLCKCATGYTQVGTTDVCKADLGTACTATSDCDTTTNPAAVCPTTGTKTCTCATGYTKQGTACKADLGTACTATSDCDTASTATAVCDVLATPKVCKIILGSTCTLTADCTPAVANSDCTGTTGSKKCTCNAGFTAQGAYCSGATGVAACLAMILACIFTTIV